MQRKELRALKRIYATPTMRRIAQDNKLDKPIVYKYSWHKYTYSTKYDMMLRCQSRGSILMIAVFFPDDVAKGFKYMKYIAILKDVNTSQEKEIPKTVKK